jgi:hypothetical protein
MYTEPLAIALKEAEIRGCLAWEVAIGLSAMQRAHVDMVTREISASVAYTSSKSEQNVSVFFRHL